MAESDPQAPAVFHHEPLQAQHLEIRLVRILPQESADHTMTINCEIFHSRLLDRPTYEVLSYVWGSEHKPYIIKIGGKAFGVTANLFAALLHFRVSVPRVFWIDAICIDQTSEDERSQQISIMRDIYALATRTSIWLGELRFLPGAGSTKFLRQIRKQYGQTIISVNHPRTPVQSISDHSAHENTWRILRCTWFSRMWVAQELACSKEVIICVGHESVSWRIWMEWITELDQRLAPNEFLPRFPLYLDKDRKVFVLDALREDYRSGKRSSLLCLLFELHEFETTEKHDRIYSLLGLAAHQTDTSSCIPVNYSVSYEALINLVVRQHQKFIGTNHFLARDSLKRRRMADDDLRMAFTRTDFLDEFIVQAWYEQQAKWPRSGYTNAPFRKDWPLVSASNENLFAHGCFLGRCQTPVGDIELAYGVGRSKKKWQRAPQPMFMLLLPTNEHAYVCIHVFIPTDVHQKLLTNAIHGFAPLSKVPGRKFGYPKRMYDQWRKELFPIMLSNKPSHQPRPFDGDDRACGIWQFLVSASGWSIIGSFEWSWRNKNEPQFWQMISVSVAEREVMLKKQ